VIQAAGTGVRGHRAAAGVLAGVSLLMGAAAARAEVIELQWQDAGRFERSLTIAPGKFAEICGPLEAGQAVQWSFDADRALNFNVHYHVDKDVRYPAKKENVKRLQGDLSVDSRQDYCWMWTNKTTASTKLSVTLTRK
jgi:hypothetical protein